MTTPRAIETTAAHAETLRALHRGPGLLVLPNAWDAASARAIEAAGFPALASTSAGVASALGFADGEHAPADEMAAAAARIVAAVGVPVTVDLEAGYGLAPAEVAQRLISIGAAGMNLEDTDHSGGGAGLVDADANAERLAAIKAAARAEGVDLVLNARVDVFIRRVGTPEEQLTEALRRARLYRDAGADCIYPILLADEAAIASIVAEVGAVNVNVRRGGPISLARAASLGVRRVSYAASLFREAATFTEEAVASVRAEADAVGGAEA